MVTFAIITGRSIDALVTALVYFYLGAFVDVAMKRFVRIIRTIGHFVTDQIIVYTLTVIASKLRRIGARHVIFFAIDFVGTIAAIVFAVAPVLHADTFEVLTGEFLR